MILNYSFKKPQTTTKNSLKFSIIRCILKCQQMAIAAVIFYLSRNANLEEDTCLFVD